MSYLADDLMRLADLYDAHATALAEDRIRYKAGNQDVVLRELRAAFGFTQEQLANRLGVQQAAVSRMERRSDITLSSLRRYVEALGGRLEITVRTPGGEHLRLIDPGE